MNMAGAHASMRQPRRRSFRKETPLKKRWIIAALFIVLLSVSIYYAFQYQKHMQYIQYPLRYEELIVSGADEFDLDPWHVAAVIRCESSFRETATSAAGARGLMQIMPETGEWISGKFDEESAYTEDSLFEPETNIKYGCWFLRWLMNRYEGDRTLVTAAYHAGHGTVDAWLSDPQISSDGKTLSAIPYESTKIYVERVLTACEKYRELYDFSQED